jgi:hypothetical protein
MMNYLYSLILHCACKDRFDCFSIFNLDDNYFLQDFIEVRFFSSDSRGILKRNVIHCSVCSKEDDVLEIFPDLVYVAANHVDLLD